MEELLHHLEKRIQSLVEQHDQLKDTNLQLSQGKSELLRERDALLASHERVAMQIEALISQLKSIEPTAETAS